MTPEILIVLTILAIAFVLFVTEWVRKFRTKQSFLITTTWERR